MKCIAHIRRRTEALDNPHDVIIYNHPNPFDHHLVRKATAKLKVFYVLELYERSLLKGSRLKIVTRPNPRTIMRMVYLKKALHSPYLILANATWMKQWLSEALGVDAKLLIGGVSTEMFHPVPVEKKPGRIRILSSGDPRPRKGLATVLAAIEIVKKYVPDLEFDTYYGKGTSQEHIAQTYCSADIFIDAQRYAGWNNPVAEAMACKVPVVCTDIGGVRDFAVHDETALLVPINDHEAMAQAVLRLIRNESLREKLRENAFAKIAQFTWPESAANLERILEEGLRGKRQ
jgi:glycosyltransferase involved in cell wall biosynthesis